jgi:hypothetical protein
MERLLSQELHRLKVRVKLINDSKGLLEQVL